MADRERERYEAALKDSCFCRRLARLVAEAECELAWPELAAFIDALHRHYEDFNNKMREAASRGRRLGRWESSRRGAAGEGRGRGMSDVVNEGRRLLAEQCEECRGNGRPQLLEHCPRCLGTGAKALVVFAVSHLETLLDVAEAATSVSKTLRVRGVDTPTRERLDAALARLTGKGESQ